MALFTDGPASGIEDLSRQDSQILDVASAEGIDLTGKLALAQEAAAIDLEAALDGERGWHSLCWGSTARIRLENIVVTPALRLWHSYRALELAYGDAYFSQLNDRFAKKRDEYAALARATYDRLLATGIGIAPRPVPRAAAPNVEAAAGTAPNGTYYVTMGWVNAAGEEGASAVPASITITGGGFLVQPAGGPAGGPSWNVYAGTAPEAMTRQNTGPVAATTTWLQSEALITSGGGPGRGQAPSFYHPLPRILQRG